MAQHQRPAMARRRVFSSMPPAGMQPCVQDGLATLSVCKPCVRKGACAGDIVVAYKSPPGRAKLSKQPAVVFAGIVHAVVPMRLYMGSAARRDSNLYTASGARSGPATAYDAEHWGWNGLSAGKVMRRDWSGKNVLLFREFYHAQRAPARPAWLAAIVAEPAFKAGDRGRRGHRVSVNISL